MSNVDEIINDIISAMRPFITKAFNAGYESGRSDANRAIAEFVCSPDANLQNRIAPAGPLPDLHIAVARAESQRARAAPGSVKPAILSIVKAEPGISVSGIERISGIKRNSVRATLWALAKEGKIERRNGGYAVIIVVSSDSVPGQPGNGNPGASNAGAD